MSLNPIIFCITSLKSSLSYEASADLTYSLKEILFDSARMVSRNRAALSELLNDAATGMFSTP